MRITSLGGDRRQRLLFAGSGRNFRLPLPRRQKAG
jgi:hypothetical protein